MQEAQVRSASLKDVSMDDFLKFCEFAYSGDYSTPPPVTRSSSPPKSGFEDTVPEPLPVSPPLSPALSPQPAETLDWGGFGVKKKAKKPTKSALLRTSFDEQCFCPVLPIKDFLDGYQIVTNSDCTEDFTPVLLAHARLYVLSDRFGVMDLKSLCLHKLHNTLIDFTLYEESIGDIVELIRFGYCNDHTPDGANDALRALLLKYVVSRHSQFGDAEPFLSLIGEGGDFARDLWSYTREHLI
jgi:hypothetical protein